jgi:hypothetical protein
MCDILQMPSTVMLLTALYSTSTIGVAAQQTIKPLPTITAERSFFKISGASSTR